LAAALVLLLLAAPELPEIPVRGGAPITLDARIGEAEWADAFSVTRDRPGGGSVRFLLKRTGPWIAFGVDAVGSYSGEVLHLYVSDASGAWITNVIVGLGHPALPPALWRRGSREVLTSADVSPGEPPRACLVRVALGNTGRWSAEVLLRLGALGIGRGDLRDLRGLVALQANDPVRLEVLTLPGGAGDPFDPKQYARLVSPDGWGAGETWPPVTPEQSREFDDAELLYRLCLEHDQIAQQNVEQMVITRAVRPRSMSRINALRQDLEAGRARNPSLPSWPYFLARLLDAGNLYGEAQQIIDTFPEPLHTLSPFAGLIAEHCIATEQFDRALRICAECPYMPDHDRIKKVATEGVKVKEQERLAVEKDAAKAEKNPRVAFHTAKGVIVIELFEDDAPAAVRNFMDLVMRRKYYDGLRFHEVEGAHAAMIGDPRTRMGSTETRPGPDWSIRKETSSRGILRGYLTTLPLADETVHGSMIVISLVPLLSGVPGTDVFGRVVEGMDVLLSLEQDDVLDHVEVLSRRNHQYDATEVRIAR